MLKIRLSRSGTKKKAFYRIVVSEEGKKANGVTVDNLGYWHPAKKNYVIDNKKLDLWLSKGAVKTPGFKKVSEQK